MTDSQPLHFLSIFLSAVPEMAARPLLSFKAKHGKQNYSWKEAAALINNLARAMQAAGLQAESRVAIVAAPGMEFWVTQWAAFTGRAIPVVIPRDFTAAELAETLLESRCLFLFADRLSTARSVAQMKASLPDLTHIFCFEGAAEGALPILAWQAFAEAGQMKPDRTAASLSAAQPRDTALLFYDRGEAGGLSAVRLSHGQLVEYAQRIRATAAPHYTPREGDLFLSAAAWEHVVGHVAACFLPVLCRGSIYIAPDRLDMACYEHKPHIVVADTPYLQSLRSVAEAPCQQMNALDRRLYADALRLSKIRYESGKLIPLHTFQLAVLRAVVLRRLCAALGGRLKLALGVDDAAGYDLHLFYNAMEAELVELPQEMFSKI